MTETLRKLAKRPKHLRRLLADESGVTAIEFGILGLPFFGIIAAILQTAVIFLSGQVLESALNDAARSVRTGQLQLSGGTIETFRDSICDRLYGLFPDCEGLHIRVVEVDNFQSATVAPPIETECDGPCEWTEDESFDPGEGRQVILAQVHYRYPVLIPLGPVGMANLPDGTHLMGSVAVFQNEPFS